MLYSNTVPLHAHRQPEIKEKLFISHLPKAHLLFYFYFSSLLSVPLFTETLRKYPIQSVLEEALDLSSDRILNE